MLALCYVQNYLSHLFHIFEFWKEVSSGRGESIPSLPKMFPPLCSESESTCLQGRVVVATGRWQCQCLPQLYGRVVYGAWPPSSWEPTAPIIGAPRASMPASLLLHSIICHSESNWGLRGNRSLYNQGSRLLIERLFLVHSLVQSSSCGSSGIVLKEIILWQFFPRHGWCHTRGWVDQPPDPLCFGNHNFSVTAPLFILFLNSKI